MAMNEPPYDRTFGTLAGVTAWDDPGSLWNRLAADDAHPDPFSGGSHWQLAFAEAWRSRRPVFLRGDNEALVAFAEKVFAPDEVALVPIEANWMFGSNLLGPRAVERLADALPCFRARHPGARINLVIGGLDPAGTLLNALMTRFGDQWSFHEQQSGLHAAAALTGGYDGWLGRRGRGFRKSVRNLARDARALGVGVQRVAPRDAVAAETCFARMLAVEWRSWKGLAGVGMETPPVRDFYRILLRRLAPWDCGRVMFATHEGRDIGFIFGGVLNGVYRGQQFSFDEAWRHAGIGNLLQLEQIAWLCEEGAERYDLGPLLGPRMAYKIRWAEIRRPVSAIIMAPHAPASDG